MSDFKEIFNSKHWIGLKNYPSSHTFSPSFLFFFTFLALLSHFLGPSTPLRANPKILLSYSAIFIENFIEVKHPILVFYFRLRPTFSDLFLSQLLLSDVCMRIYMRWWQELVSYCKEDTWLPQWMCVRTCMYILWQE